LVLLQASSCGKNKTLKKPQKALEGGNPGWRSLGLKEKTGVKLKKNKDRFKYDRS